MDSQTHASDPAPAGIGHNSPPDDFELALERAQAEFDALRAELKLDTLFDAARRWEGITIKADREAENLTNLLVRLGKAAKRVDAARRDAKKPFDAAGKQVQAMFVPHLDLIDKQRKALDPVLTAWNRKKQEEADAERRKREAEAAALAAEAEKKAAEARSVDEQAEAARLKARAEETQESVREVDHRTRSDHGAMSTTHKRWTFEVTDPAAVPREWLMVDEKKIGAAVRRKDNPVREIPGVRIFRTDSSLVRG